LNTYIVVFSPEALLQLAELYHHIAGAASPEIAARYTDAIVTHCEALSTFPMRGTIRDDIRRGLRLTNYRGRSITAFSVLGDTVAIIGVFYGGQNFEAALQDGEP
jgi:plasmid stabilization system protein ParE